MNIPQDVVVKRDERWRVNAAGEVVRDGWSSVGLGPKHFPESYVLTGRYGDLMIGLRALKLVADWRGGRVRVVVASQYAGLLSGCSYVEPVVVNVMDLDSAARIAANYGEFAVLNCHTQEQNRGKNYMLSIWQRTGVPVEQCMSAPLVIDRRDAKREAQLVASIPRLKPWLLYNFSGQSSPFPQFLSVLTELRRYEDRFQLVDLGKIQATRIYDLLGLYDLAAGLVSIDTSTLHLANASSVPVVAFTVDGWGSSIPPKSTVLEIKYSQALARLGELRRTLETLGKTPRKEKVTAIVAVYRPDKARLERCLAALDKQVDEVFVVGDGASIIPSVNAKVLRSPETDIGYGRKVNYAVPHARNEWLMFVNDDVYLEPDVVAKCMAAADEKTGMVAHLLRYPDGTIQMGGTGRRGDGLDWEHLDVGARESRFKDVTEMENVCGASILVRKAAFPGFDPRYYLYCEDNDLCLTMREKGWKILFHPGACGVHEQGASTSQTPNMQRHLRESTEYFHGKWGGYLKAHPHWPPMRIAVICGYLDSYRALADYTVEVNKREYCNRHGYTLLVPRKVEPKWSDGRSHASGFTWSRLEYLRDTLKSGKYDWVWTVGADTLVTNMATKLETIIAYGTSPAAESNPTPVYKRPALPFIPNSLLKPAANGKRTGKRHILICGECVTPIQADSFMVRSSPEGIGWVEDVLAHYQLYRHHPWVENQTMIDLMDKHAAITGIIPQWMMNSYDYSRFYHLHPIYRSGKDWCGNRGQWEPGDFLIHWAGAGMDERKRFLEQYKPLIRK